MEAEKYGPVQIGRSDISAPNSDIDPVVAQVFLQYLHMMSGEPPTKAGKNRLHPGGRRNFEINPMKNYATRPGHLKKQPRCGARTRAGVPCQRPPIRGRKRCRLHGGLSPGAPRGVKNGNYKTGDWTSEAINERKWLRSLVQSFAKSGATE
jgi:hypothetical protein